MGVLVGPRLTEDVYVVECFSEFSATLKSRDLFISVLPTEIMFYGVSGLDKS